MREDRFFINLKIEKGFLKVLDKEIFHLLKNVLRKRVGERIIFFNENLTEGIGEIKNFLKNGVEIEILEVKKNEKESKTFVSLCCSVLKKQNFELVVQKATEIGVKEIIPLICKNTVKTGLNLERVKKISKEAAEQAGRGLLPKILEPIKFNEAVEKIKETKILFDPSGGDFRELIAQKTKNLAVFVGPEGGWSREEVNLARKEGFKILNLGKLTLRAETAAIVGSFLAVNLLN